MSPKDDDRESIQTTIRVQPRVWQMLRALAEQRSLAQGGRPSASAVIAELVEAETKVAKERTRAR